MLQFVPAHNTAFASKIFFLFRVVSITSVLISLGLTSYFVSLSSNGSCPGWLIGALLLDVLITFYTFGSLVVLKEQLSGRAFGIMLVLDLVFLGVSVLIDLFIGTPLDTVQCKQINNITAASNITNSSDFGSALGSKVGNAVANFASNNSVLCDRVYVVYAMWILLTICWSFSVLALIILAFKNRNIKAGAVKEKVSGPA